MGLAPRNARVHALRALARDRQLRRESAEVLIEGATLIAEAASAGWTILEEFHSSAGKPVVLSEAVVLSDAALERIATTEHPQPNIATATRSQVTPLNSCSTLLVLDRIADPGNLGTLVRSAEAAGIDAVVVTPGSTDPFSPKVIRASAGAIFHQSIIECELAELRNERFRLVGTSSHRGEHYRECDWSGKVAIVLGNEAHGLDDDAPIDTWVQIPHGGRSESLNVAMAGTLVAFALAESRSA